jgi:hypothetical protein
MNRICLLIKVNMNKICFLVKVVFDGVRVPFVNTDNTMGF